jgi:hypothetical protein
MEIATRAVGEMASILKRLTVAIFALALVTSAEATDSANDPSLEIIPAEVTTRTLPKGTPIQLEIRLKAGDAELNDISISTFSNDGIVAHFGGTTPAKLPKLAPRADYSWRLELTRDTGSVLTDSILHVRAAFDVTQAGNAGATSGAASPLAAPIHRLIYATAKIKPPAIISGIELAKVEIKGAPETLAHERPGHLIVVITNQYSRTLTVSDVKLRGPAFIELIDPAAPKSSTGQASQGQSAQTPIQILPGQAIDIPYIIKAASEVVPGKYPLIATVTAKTEDGLTATARTAPLDINVVVLGESDILKFLGIPSLLFLPGVVMLFTWRFLWSWGKPGDQVAKYPIQVNTSDFWIIAVALSLISALLYPWLTQFLLEGPRNFVAAYGLLDFGLIIGFSLFVTALVFAVFRAFTEFRQWQEARKIAKSIPNTGDSPLAILDKLANLKKDTLFEQVYFTGGNPAERLLVLEPWSLNELWLVPPAELRGINRRNYVGLDETDKLVSGQLLDSGAIAEKVRHGIAQGWWAELTWRRVGDFRRPVKVQPGGWTKLSHRARLIPDD